MGFTDPRIAASMFAILVAVASVGMGAGLIVGGSLSDIAGYRWTFILIAALNPFALPLIAPIFGEKQAGRQWEGPG